MTITHPVPQGTVPPLRQRPPATQALPTAVPRQALRAVWAGIAAAVCSMAVYTLSWRGITDTDLTRWAHSVGASHDQTRAVVNTLYAMALLAALALTAAWIVLLIQVLRGRHWARLILTSLAIPWLFVNLPFVLGLTDGGVLPSLAGAVDISLVTAALVSLHTRNVRDHCHRPPPR